MDTNEDFFAVLQFVDEPSIQLRRFRIQIRLQRQRHDFVQRKTADLVVLVDVSDNQPMG